MTLSNVSPSELISTQCAFLVQVEMTSHDVDDDNGPPENQKYWWGQSYVVGLICPHPPNL